MSHVSLSSSNVHKPHHIRIENSIKLTLLPNLDSWLASIIAMAISINSNPSSQIDIGIPPPEGIGESFIWTKKLTSNKAQNADILHLKNT
jgi:hypothetical protein